MKPNSQVTGSTELDFTYFTRSTEIESQSAQSESGLQTLQLHQSIPASSVTFNPQLNDFYTAKVLSSYFNTNAQNAKLYLSAEEKRKIRKSTSIGKYWKKILASITVIGLFSLFSIGLMFFLETEENQQQIAQTQAPTLDPTIFLSCEDDLAQSMRQLLEASRVDSSSGVLRINNAVLPCIPVDPLKTFKQDLTEEITNFFFSDCDIRVVAENAFSDSSLSSMSTLQLWITGDLLYFGDHNLSSLGSFFAIGTENQKFILPNTLSSNLIVLGLRNLDFQDFTVIPDFFETSVYIYVAFENIGLNDNTIIQYRDAMETFQEQKNRAPFVMDRSDSIRSFLTFASEPKLTTIPSRMFGARLVQGIGMVLQFSNLPELTTFEDGVFLDQFNFASEVWVRECPKFTVLPEAFKELRSLVALSFLNTNLSIIQDNFFSEMHILTLSFEGSPIQPTCDGLSDFRTKYGIRESTVIDGLDCEELF
eukprot:snap_masked-scaffold_22-processed-gene-2.3-mRNA-1 protein AED:1.00 eAED:1.00 QI:0/-1/0/0/-1/1/1/0/477